MRQKHEEQRPSVAGLLSGFLGVSLSRERCAAGRWLPVQRPAAWAAISAGSASGSKFPENTEMHPLPGGSAASLVGEWPWDLGNASAFLLGCCF